MSKRGKQKEIRKHNFSFLGLMKCKCGASITAETQKGFIYYRCTKKKGLCKEKHFLREEMLTDQIKSFLCRAKIQRKFWRYWIANRTRRDKIHKPRSAR